jgi:hypothetical protein
MEVLQTRDEAELELARMIAQRARGETFVALPPKGDRPLTLWQELWRFGAVVAALGPADDRASLMVMEDELGRPSRQRRYPSSSHRPKARWGACR